MAEENKQETREDQVGAARPEEPERVEETVKAGTAEGPAPEAGADRPGKAEKPKKAEKAEKAGKPKKAKKGDKGDKAKKAEKHEESPPMPPGYVPRMLKRFHDEAAPALQKRFGYKNIHRIPKLSKIVVNMGVGEGMKESKLLDAAVEDLATITGQRPTITKARKSVASFKVRKGMSLGCKVTMRGMRMYEFFDRLVTSAIPRIRDFRGLSPDSFDGHGNYTFGIKEQIVFPEIDYDKVAKIMGMDITIATTCQTDEEALELLRGLGMPFRTS